ncbi:hypothetical protein [Aequorivita antarctica]|uniref:Uncharacterized protein n=1 Tax=Aequorivita antarctica TaxID=153266 RepID=A0A5C6YY57_9FLAO|nr:hypothetical protein [Aequorivita antarctica]TXD72083.1 hypothetical protein ESU54_13575 [Aequorivita antarctica]SRX75643.1 hypothetical protein AEQU3_02639 [Aequorivita antarctica]
MNNSFLKIIFASLSGFAAILSVIAFFSEEKIEIKYSILAETNVLDLNADVNKLEVIYDSINLNRNNLNLKIYSIKIENIGNKSLSPNFYEVSDSIGVKLKGGKVIDQPEIVQTSSNYLDEKLKVVLNKSSELKFSQVILDPKEFFIIKILVLHKNNAKLQVISTGKIASQKDIPVITELDKEKNNSFIGRIFEGSILIQIIRFLIPLIVVSGLFLFIGLKNGAKHDKTHINWRHNNIDEFLKSEYYNDEFDYNDIFEKYRRYGTYPFLMLAAFLEEEGLFNSLFRNFKKEIDNPLPQIIMNNTTPLQKVFISDVNWWLIGQLIKDGSIIESDGNWYFEENFRRKISSFINFLNKNNKLEFIDDWN